MEPILPSDPRTVLIAVDGSEGSDVAFDWALANYCKPKDMVQLLHVRRPLDDLVRWKLPSEAVSKMEFQADIACRGIINGHMKKCADANLNCGWKIAEGDEREEICKEVLRVCADVLIVGSRGLNVVKRALLGSISEYCAHHCACPVIIVRAKDAAAKAGKFVCDDRLMTAN